MDPISCVELENVHCESAGQLLASIYNFKGVSEVPYLHVHNFFGYNECSENLDLGFVISLYDAWAGRVKADKQLMTDFREILTSDSTGCRLDFCRALNFSGNADFAGIGVMVSFCIQSSVATCFAIFSLACIFGTETFSENWRFFRRTFHAFFITSVYINIAIGLAAASTIARENKTQHTAIFTTLGLLLSLSSTQMLWYLQRLHTDSEEKPPNPDGSIVKPRSTGIFTNRHLIQFCLGLLWVVLLVLCAVIIRVNWESEFEVFCFHRLKALLLATGLLYSPIGLVAIGLICAVLKKIFPGEKNDKRWDWVDPTTVFLGLVLMWLAFGVLWYLRTQLDNITGEGYQDNNWGFGQVAAVAAWLPTLVVIVRDSLEFGNPKGRASTLNGITLAHRGPPATNPSSLPTSPSRANGTGC